MALIEEIPSRKQCWIKTIIKKNIYKIFIFIFFEILQHHVAQFQKCKKRKEKLYSPALFGLDWWKQKSQEAPDQRAAALMEVMTNKLMTEWLLS